MEKAQDLCVFINLAVSARVVRTQFCFNSNVYTIRNGPEGWVGDRKSKEIYKFLFMEANISFGSLGDNKVQRKLISTLASIPGSFHRGSDHVRKLTALHNDQGPAKGHCSVNFPLS